MIVESWLTQAAAASPQKLAVEDGQDGLTYAELYRQAQAGAAELRADGVDSGDAVAIALGPGLPFAVALHSCWLAGANAVPVDVRLSAAQRRTVAAGCRLTIEQPLPVGQVASVPSAGVPGVGVPGVGLALDLNAVAVTIHTSGTTSEPKRVELTFGNLLWSAQGSAIALGIDPRERWLCTLPVCHIGGLSILVRSAIYATTAVLHERFETERVLDALIEQGVTLISVVANTLGRLLEAGLQHPPQLRCALAGGGPVPAALLERAATAGVPVCQTYGLTEACSQVSTVPLAALSMRGRAGGDGDGRPGANARMASSAALGAGRPLFCTHVRIASESGMDDGGGAEGEILLAGPTVAPGALSTDGWLHTGDLGRLDAEGNLHVTGRKADTIISGGENVAPAEVEAALESHPQVAEAAVIGRPHPRWGEAVTAIVVPGGGRQPDLQELKAHCAQRLAPYKVPKSFVMIEGPLPRTPSGKLLRRQLI